MSSLRSRIGSLDSLLGPLCTVTRGNLGNARPREDERLKDCQASLPQRSHPGDVRNQARFSGIQHWTRGLQVGVQTADIYIERVHIANVVRARGDAGVAAFSEAAAVVIVIPGDTTAARYFHLPAIEDVVCDCHRP